MVVATDDNRIADHARELGADALLTETGLDSGSARAFAAARHFSPASQFVINLQGDAPFIPPSIVAGLLNTLRSGGADMATPVYQLDWSRLDRLREHKRSAPFSGTTCIRDSAGRALWFSKSILPTIRDEERLRAVGALSPVWQHIGLYGYRMDALAWFPGQPCALQTVGGT